jgi:integrase
MDLFSHPKGLATFHRYAFLFESWQEVMQRQRSITSEEGWGVFEDMWHAFARSCTLEGRVVQPESLTRTDLERFIASRDGRTDGVPTPRYVWRLLDLIDRIMEFGHQQHGLPAFPHAMELLSSRKEWQYANARKNEAPVDYLNAASARALVDHLTQVRPRAETRPTRGDWLQIRNATSLALQLGAGLTPGEVRELTLSAIVTGGPRSNGLPWKIRIPGGAQSPARETPIAIWASRVLACWLQWRAELAIPGIQLLPSTKSGKPWSKQTQHDAHVAVFNQLGWTPDQIAGGAFRLRHTFAIRNLRKGFAEGEVAKWLGIEPKAMARYRGLIQEPIANLV